MNVGVPTGSVGEQIAEGVGYAHSTVDIKDRITLKEGRGITKSQVSNEHCQTN
jgi:hypothetical protein